MPAEEYFGCAYLFFSQCKLIYQWEELSITITKIRGVLVRATSAKDSMPSLYCSGHWTKELLKCHTAYYESVHLRRL